MAYLERWSVYPLGNFLKSQLVCFGGTDSDVASLKSPQEPAWKVASKYLLCSFSDWYWLVSVASSKNAQDRLCVMLGKKMLQFETMQQKSLYFLF